MKVGSLVECVYSSRKDGCISSTQLNMIDAGYTSPIVGGIYTVRGFTENYKGIFLEEIINPPIMTYRGIREVGFTISAFREVQPPMDLTELLEECVSIEHY